MHQVHHNHSSGKHLDVGYRGINHAALRKFGKTCARRPHVVGLQLKKIREPQLIIIRNKHTKEVVDLEELVGYTIQRRKWRGIIIAMVVITAELVGHTTQRRNWRGIIIALVVITAELVGHTTQRRNWRGIIIALVVITAVCALIIATIILLTPNNASSPTKSKFTFEDFITSKYSPRSFSPTWVVGEDAFYYRNNDGAVIKYICSSNTSIVIMDNSTFKEYDTSSYTISPDGKHALVPYDITDIYRHSKRSKYRLHSIQSGHSTALTGPKGDVFQFVKFTPVGQGLVFVQDNDIYYRPSYLSDDYTRVTNTGVPGLIFNGVPDWVYEEEVLMTDSALWWSPMGGHFLYASFNDTTVKEYDLTYYGSLSNQYVENRVIYYPKAGTPNPEVTVHLYNVASNTTVVISPPASLQNSDPYIIRVVWKDEDTVIISWMNRAQNLSVFTLCNTSGNCYENFQYESTTGWNEMVVPEFSDNSNDYFIIIPQREGDAGSFKHIARIDGAARVDLVRNFDGTRKFMTTGHYDVLSILKLDTTRELIYYLAYKSDDPTVRHLYSTSINESAPDFMTPTCISCTVGETCTWVSADFSHTGVYYMLKCFGPGVPTYTLKSVTNTQVGDTCTWVSADFSHTGSYYMLKCFGPGMPAYTLKSVTTTQVVVFEDNKDIEEELSKLSLPRTKILQIPVSKEKKMWAKLLLPYDLKEDEKIQYDLLVSVYGGPGSQRVTSAFQLGWEDYLASSHNIVIGYLDGRGSMGRGDAWMHSIYRQLGTVEVDDSITAGRYFKGLSYINDNTAIWGWSYGGYLTSMAIGQGTGVFKCGMAVAPVTDYRYYDSIYTERYMGQPTPEDNKLAYDFGNVSLYAEQFKKARYMVVHGTGDDNVHFQNTAQLVKALTEADVYFRSQFYTDRQHSIKVGNSRRHLWNSLEDFLLQCYGNPTSIDAMNRESMKRNAHPVNDKETTTTSPADHEDS